MITQGSLRFFLPSAEVLVLEGFFHAMLNAKRRDFLKTLITRPEDQEGLICTSTGEHFKSPDLIFKESKKYVHLRAEPP